MAQRRMFSLDIVASDAFLEMPISSQSLYFHLGMYADDDGFVNPKKIVRMISASDDDLKILLAKRFLLPFPNGVVVVKHWKINNYIQNDRYHETKYLEEKKSLTIKENGSYTESIQNVSKMDTEASLGKASLELDKSSPPKGGEAPEYGKQEINQIWQYGKTLGFSQTKQTLNRYAINRLLKNSSVEQIKQAAEFSQKIRDEAYAPQINNWMDLEEKILKLRDWYKRNSKPKESKTLKL
jgi:hypothetical protein